MNRYTVSWHTYTLYGGRYDGKKIVYADDATEAYDKTKRMVQQDAFQDVSLSSIKIDTIELANDYCEPFGYHFR